ncbi:MAG: purple acid phosphatase family protein [Planctomycetota bacterium]|jgi:tetratricopeptide (TPR) repeat protein
MLRSFAPRRPSRSALCALLLTVSTLCAATAGAAAAAPHDGTDAQLASLEERLARSPDDPELLLEHADLLRRRHDYGGAFAGALRLAEQPAPPAGLHLLRARLFDEIGQPEDALEELSLLLARTPRETDGLILRARLLGRLGDAAGAEAAWDAVLVAHPQPQPDHYLARARAVLARGPLHTERALAGLHAGLQRLGPCAPLLRLAAELELDAGRPAAARALLAESVPSAQRGAGSGQLSTATTVTAAVGQVVPPPASAGEPLVTLVPAGSPWLYLDDGSNQGTAWKEPGFDHGGWSAGTAQLGYGDGDESTVVSFGPNPANKYVTTYFRHAFAVADPAAWSAVYLHLLRDDGAVVYLNGEEVFRSNLPAGTITSTTYAVGTVSGAEETLYELIVLSPDLLVSGSNVLAVEIHQRSADSSDISFDLRLEVGTSTIVTRGPYLQLATPDSLVVRWSTSDATDTRVVHGPLPGQFVSQTVDPTPTMHHEIQLTGLLPETTSYYAVGSSTELFAGGDATHRFTTPPETGSAVPTRVWAIGDSGTGNENAAAVRDAFLAFNGGQPPDAWLMLGDNAYTDGTELEYQAAVFDMYAEILRQAPLWPARGNHDRDEAVYTGAFTLPTAGQAGGVPSGTESYYSFDLANIHFVCLDSLESDHSVGGAMWTWLQCDLAASDAEWLIAYWHHPPYSKGSHDSDDEILLVEMRENFLPLLEAAGVDLVLSGHSHSYERSMFLDGHYDVSTTLLPSHVIDGGNGGEFGTGAYTKPAGPREGAVYCVAGCSGKTSSAPLDHPVMVKAIETLGSVVLDVDDDRLDVTFLDDSGAVLDKFTILHSAPVAWSDLGSGLAGTHGAPVLGAEGTLQPDSPLTLLLCSARESTLTTLFVGSSILSAPFKGGVLVPSPDLALFGLMTDATGTLSLSTTWPAGVPSGVTLVSQAWLADPAGPVGLAASNAIAGTAP